MIKKYLIKYLLQCKNYTNIYYKLILKLNLFIPIDATDQSLAGYCTGRDNVPAAVSEEEKKM
jgi:hypothetical protein